MKFTIRTGVFETNSSSTHTYQLIILDEEVHEEYYIYLNWDDEENQKILENENKYIYEDFEYDNATHLYCTPEEKLCFLERFFTISRIMQKDLSDVRIYLKWFKESFKDDEAFKNYSFLIDHFDKNNISINDYEIASNPNYAHIFNIKDGHEIEVVFTVPYGESSGDLFSPEESFGFLKDDGTPLSEKTIKEKLYGIIKNDEICILHKEDSY